MSINVKELVKGKSMLMTDEEVSKVVSDYMIKVTLEQLKWTLSSVSKTLETFSGYCINIPSHNTVVSKNVQSYDYSIINTSQKFTMTSADEKAVA